MGFLDYTYKINGKLSFLKFQLEDKKSFDNFCLSLNNRVV